MFIREAGMGYVEVTAGGNTLNLDTAMSFEKLVPVYQTTRRHRSEVRNVNYLIYYL
jgi:hypothetical protein